MNNKFMKRAIELSIKSVNSGTGPFGALIVKDNKVISEGFNTVTLSKDPTSHAEIVAIRNACKVLNNFSMVNGQSSEAAIAMTDMTYQMSEQAGLNPQVIFQDIASASGDTLASFSGSADELAKSAVTARRLGLTLDDMAKVSSSLLDFETSIEKEMEAQLITGMDLNFQKARMLAMQGDEAGAMEEVMRQVGGLDKFNNMAPIKQSALAEAGSSTETVQSS